MENIETAKQSKKKGLPTDYKILAANIGSACLQGLILGATGAIGAKFVNQFGSKPFRGTEAEIFPIRKSGT